MDTTTRFTKVLTDSQIAYVDKRHSVYDHSWRLWAETLGEPFLVSELLAFYDGELLNICGFPLGTGLLPVDTSRVQEVLCAFDDHNVQAVQLWVPLSFKVGTPALGELQLISKTEYGEDYDVAVDIQGFSYAANKTARLAKNAVRNKGYVTSIEKRQYLLAGHIAAIADWARLNRVGKGALSVAMAIQGLIKYPTVWVAETYLADKLVGMGIVETPNANAAVLLQSFARDIPGGRVGDSLLGKLIDWCGQRGILRLHLGYSPNKGIRRFKAKWSAIPSGPPYAFVRYARSVIWQRLFDSEAFNWRERLSASAEDTT